MTMRKTIHLRFSVDVEDMAEAWAIIDGLEKAAMKRDFVGVSSWIESDGSERSSIMVDEGQEAPMSSAEETVRMEGLQPTGIGDPNQVGEGPVIPRVRGRED